MPPPLESSVKHVEPVGSEQPLGVTSSVSSSIACRRKRRLSRDDGGPSPKSSGSISFEEALEVRRGLQLRPHPLLEGGSTPFSLLHRFKEPKYLLEYKVAKARHKRAYLRFHNHRFAGPNWADPKPLITKNVKRCWACGSEHVTRSSACPIAQLKAGRELDRWDIWVQYPCLHCDSTDHLTRMCRDMHGLCSVCKVRGHGAEVHHNIDAEKIVDGCKEHFKRFSHLGHKTRLANGKEDHRWGLRPDLSAVTRLPTDISDSEMDL